VDRVRIQREDWLAKEEEGTVIRRLGVPISVAIVMLLSVGSPHASARRADVAAVPASIHFGSRQVGDVASHRLLFRNMSEQQVVVYALSVGAGFSIESLTCFDESLSPGGRCEVIVSFLPAQVGKWSSTLRIQYCFPTDPLCPGAVLGQERFLEVPLSGTAR
jgi:hypothetical protein